MNEEMLRTEGLTVGYHAIPLIQDLTFQIHRGEIVTLIGPNGAGKSTILKTLAGSLKKQGGTIYMDQTDMAQLSGAERAKKLSVLLTNRLRSGYFTCRDVIETGRYPYTGRFGVLSKADHDAVERAMALVSVTELADTDFDAISDGQRQRVLLAKAICQEPELLILDEPTSYLDIHHKILFLEILKRLAAEENIAVLVSMHELDFAERISDYTICIKDNSVFRIGTPQEIFTRASICALFEIPEDLYQVYFPLST